MRVNTRKLNCAEKTLEAGLMGRVAARKPLLSRQNRVKRLAWAKKCKHWTAAGWKNVLWTDEFEFDSSLHSFHLELPNFYNVSYFTYNYSLCIYVPICGIYNHIPPKKSKM